MYIELNLQMEENDHSTLSKSNDSNNNEKSKSHGRAIWKESETDALIDIMYGIDDINLLNDSRSTGPVLKRKNEIYNQIHEQLMMSGKCHHEWSVQAIKNKYDNMKTLYKKRSAAAKQYAGGTGGGNKSDESWRDTRMEHIIGHMLYPYENKNDSSSFNYSESDTLKLSKSFDQSSDGECQIVTPKSSTRVDKKRKISSIDSCVNSRIEETAKVEFDTANVKHETALIMRETAQLKKEYIEKKVKLIDLKLNKMGPLSNITNSNQCN